LHPPLTLRVNIKKLSITDYLALLTKEGIEATHAGGQAVILDKPIPVEKIPQFAEGVVSVQDYGAQLAAHLLGAPEGARVLDACAAPGGKTGHILELANVNLTAIDNDAQRLKRVADNLKRLDLSANLKVGDAAKPETWWDETTYDYILADVPCTASGIVRRHVDIKWLRRETDIATFTQQQSAILQQMWQCLAKKGKLLYVTCSIFNEENQQQIDNFLQKNTDATQLPLLLTNDIAKNIKIEHGQLIPTIHHDGFFYALLQKT